MSHVVLQEHTDAHLDLAAADVAVIAGPLRQRFGIQAAMDGAGYVINPGSTVGVLRLPSGMQVEIRPKVPLRNLLWMLSYVDGFTFDRLDDTVDIQRFDEIIEIVADAFAHMVERRIDLGLYRNYVEEEDNLTTVRGRILIAPDIHHNAILRHRTYCRYTTYSWDLPENQVIRDVVHRLSRWGLSRKLTGRLMALDHQLDEVSRVQFRAPDIDRFTYNRQSEDYRHIHRLCQFFLEGASLSEDAGEIAFDGFLLDMNTLFEKLISKALRDRLRSPLFLREQLHTTLDTGGRVPMRPDLVISSEAHPMMVADCKYKRLSDDQHCTVICTRSSPTARSSPCAPGR